MSGLRKTNLILSLFLVVCLSFAVMIMIQFRSFQKESRGSLQKNPKSFLQLFHIESKIEELLRQNLKVVKGKANEEFFQNQLDELIKNFDLLNIEELAEVRKQSLLRLKELKGLVISKNDLFDYYRDLKANTFNLYRLSWNYKWMNVAKGVSFLTQDLDHSPPDEAEGAMTVVQAKIDRLNSYVSKSGMTAEGKGMVTPILDQMKVLATNYLDAVDRSKRISQERERVLHLILAEVKSIHDEVFKVNNKQFNDSESFGLKLILLLATGFLAQLILVFIVAARNRNYLSSNLEPMRTQFKQWYGSQAVLGEVPDVIPRDMDTDWSGLWDDFYQVVRKIKTIRREELLIKRNIGVPYILINKEKQACFWNSALAMLVKVRTYEDLGTCLYSSVLRLELPKGEAGSDLDTLEKVFREKTLQKKKFFANAMGEKIPVELHIAPLFGPSNGKDNVVEYLMITITDLREFEQSVDRELGAALKEVDHSLITMLQGNIPITDKKNVRIPVQNTLGQIHKVALRFEERRQALMAKLKDNTDHLERESNLMRSFGEKVAVIVTQIEDLRKDLNSTKQGQVAALEMVKTQQSNIEPLKQAFRLVFDSAFQIQVTLEKACHALDRVFDTLKHGKGVGQEVVLKNQAMTAMIEGAVVKDLQNSLAVSQLEQISPEVQSILNNVADMLVQFEGAYRFIFESVKVYRHDLVSLQTELKSNVDPIRNLRTVDEQFVQHVKNLERFQDTQVQVMPKVLTVLQDSVASIDRVQNRMGVLADQSEKMNRYSKSSIELQEHIEKNFKSLIEL